MGRKIKGDHPDDDIQRAIDHALARKWTLHQATGHAWGILRCPDNSSDCRCGEFCQISVWSTPKVPRNHANHIRRVVDRCIFADGRKKT